MKKQPHKGLICPGCGKPVGRYWLKKHPVCPHCGKQLRDEEPDDNKSD